MSAVAPHAAVRLKKNFTQLAEFTLTIEDAQEYVYSISPTKRVRGRRDIEVKLYI